MKKSGRLTVRAFTLIELLVVISIISLLSSIIVASTNVVKAKTRDTKKIAEAASVRTAVNLMYNDVGYVPHNYDCTANISNPSNPCVVNNSRTTLETEDLPGATPTEPGQAYLASMNELYPKYITAIPHSPGGGQYNYYDYGSGPVGAIFGGALEMPSITNGYPTGSCNASLLIYGAICPVDFIPDVATHQCDPINEGTTPQGVPVTVLCSHNNGSYRGASPYYCSCTPY